VTTHVCISRNHNAKWDGRPQAKASKRTTMWNYHTPALNYFGQATSPPASAALAATRNMRKSTTSVKP
jgi:hypothetical protein